MYPLSCFAIKLARATKVLCCSALLALTACPSAEAEHARPTFARLALRIRADRSVGPKWKVIRAEVSEGAIGLWGSLKIQNVSGAAVGEVRFYAQYFDRTGRVCFTLVFSSRANSQHLENDTSIFRPGEIRELLAPAPGLGPAVRPEEVDIGLISERVEGQPWRLVGGHSAIHSPITINNFVVEPTLRLEFNEPQRNSAVIDLVFAKLTANADGELENVDVLQSFNTRTRSWFDAFIHQPHMLRPATAGLENIPGTAFLLIRILNDPGRSRAAVLPRDSAWVREYIRGVQGVEIPSVTQLLFSPSAKLTPLPIRLPDGSLQAPQERVRDPNLFEYASAGSSWSGSTLGWAIDPTSHRQSLTWRFED